MAVLQKKTNKFSFSRSFSLVRKILILPTELQLFHMHELLLSEVGVSVELLVLDNRQPQLSSEDNVTDENHADAVSLSLSLSIYICVYMMW